MSYANATGQAILNSSPDESLDRVDPSPDSQRTDPVVPVESYADRLMDELFDEVEQLLGGNKTPQEPEPSNDSPVEAPPPPNPSIPLSLTLPQVPASDPPLSDQAIVSPNLQQPSLQTQEPASPVPSPPKRSYDRLILGVGCVSLLVALGIWLLYQETHRPAAVPVASAPASDNSNTDQAFANYMQRSLQVIDQKSQPPTSNLGLNLPPATLPTVVPPATITPPTSLPGTNSVGAAPSNPSTGLARLYAPFYQSQPSPGSARVNPFGGAPSVVPLPTLPPAGMATIKPPIPLSVPGVARTLVGVIEMGDQSAILVEINGVAQRFKLGESIGSSGWTLVEVSKNQAIVRRNGEVRSVFTGQSF